MKRIFITGASSGIGLAIAAHKNGHNAPISAEVLLWKRPGTRSCDDRAARLALK